MWTLQNDKLMTPEELEYTLTLRLGRQKNRRVHEIAAATRRKPAEIYRWFIDAGILAWDQSGELPDLAERKRRSDVKRP